MTQQIQNPPETRKLSPTALVSMILGFVLCIPFLTGLVAVIFAFMGMSATSGNRRSGRGFAVTGLILGLSNIVIWALITPMLYGFWSSFEPAIELAKTTAMEISENRIDQALGRFDSSYGVTADDLRRVRDAVQSRGGVKDILVTHRDYKSENGRATWTITGTARYNNGDETSFGAVLVGPSDNLKMAGIEFGTR